MNVASNVDFEIFELQITVGMNQEADLLSVGAALVYALNVVRLGKAAEVTDPLSLAFTKAGSQFLVCDCYSNQMEKLTSIDYLQICR